MPAIDHPLIDRFLESLWLEKGLSAHTRAAYRSDLALFNGWLQARDVQLADVGRELILDHLAWRLNEGYKARSTARLLSGLRGFYRFLLREQLISRDPTLQVDLPQLGRPLPKSLSEADVEALLAAPELDDPIGLRDRAMLEVLYACGLRVSELIGLTLEQVICAKACCGCLARVARSVWCRWVKRRLPGLSATVRRRGRFCWMASPVMCCFPVSVASR